MKELEDISYLTKQLDSLVLQAGSVKEMHRKLNTLNEQGLGGWVLLRAPQFVTMGVLVGVVVRWSKDE